MSSSSGAFNSGSSMSMSDVMIIATVGGVLVAIIHLTCKYVYKMKCADINMCYGCIHFSRNLDIEQNIDISRINDNQNNDIENDNKNDITLNSDILPKLDQIYKNSIIERNRWNTFIRKSSRNANDDSIIKRSKSLSDYDEENNLPLVKIHTNIPKFSEKTGEKVI